MSLIRLIFRTLWVAFELAIIGMGIVLGFIYLPIIAPQPSTSSSVKVASKVSRNRSSKPIIDSKLDALKYALTRRDASLSPAEIIRRCPPLPSNMNSKDYYAARALILNHASPWVRQLLIDRLYLRWSAQDCEGALASSMSLLSSSLQRLAIDRALGLWMEKDEPAAWAWAAQFEDAAVQAIAVETLLSQGTATRAALAAMHAQSLDEPMLRLHLMSHVTQAWAKLDPTSARAWVLHLDEPQLRALLLPSMLHINASEPDQVFDDLMHEPDLAVRREALVALFAQGGLRDPALLRQWSTERDLTPEFQRPLFEAACRAGSGSFENWLATTQSLPDGPLSNAYKCGLVCSWASTRQAETMWQLLQQIPACMERNAALIAVGKSFIRSSPNLPKEHWINTLPASPDRDHLLIGLAQSLASAQPKQALEWLTQMQDQVWKQQCLAVNFAEWRERDSPRALAWLWSTPLLALEVKKSLVR